MLKYGTIRVDITPFNYLHDPIFANANTKLVSFSTLSCACNACYVYVMRMPCIQVNMEIMMLHRAMGFNMMLPDIATTSMITVFLDMG